MSKRFIVATFADKTTLTRTTTSPSLAWAWRANATWKHNGIPMTNATGFSSSHELADKAARLNSKYMDNLTVEIVPAVEHKVPVKAKPSGAFRVRRTWQPSTKGNWKFIKDGKSHRRFDSRVEAQTYIESMYANNCIATYEIV
ncbi:MAG TPA: hypothetical protein VMT30_02485 [Candidatus Saccharimonadia bacterium]|nr:hypothetical protein [Candidatus Saccharimonadia bacterium]